METCPKCGYQEPPSGVKPVENNLNNFISEDGKAECVINSNADEVLQEKTGVKWIKRSVFVKRQSKAPAPKEPIILSIVSVPQAPSTIITP